MKHPRVLAACCLLVVSAAAHAQQAYPNRPIRWVLPFSVGGASDAAVRLMPQRMAPILGQELVVDPKPGAGGVIGTDLVANAPPDGYTIAWGGSAPLAGDVTLQKNMSSPGCNDCSSKFAGNSGWLEPDAVLVCGRLRRFGHRSMLVAALSASFFDLGHRKMFLLPVPRLREE